MSQTENFMQQGGGLVDNFLPHPYETWQKFLNLKQKNPYASRDELIQKMIQKTALITGGVGAVTSLGGFTTLIFLLPADVFISTRMEAELVYMIAYAHGLSPDDADLKMFIYWILAGETAKAMGRSTAQLAAQHLATHKAKDMAMSAAKDIAMEVGMEAGKSAYGKVNKLFHKMGQKTGRQAAQNVTRKAARKGITKVLTKTVPRLVAKIVPLLGLVVGFGVNFMSSRSIGAAADTWFRNLPQFYDEIDTALLDDKAKGKPKIAPPRKSAVREDFDLFLDEPAPDDDDLFLDEPVNNTLDDDDLFLDEPVAEEVAPAIEAGVTDDIVNEADDSVVKEIVPDTEAIVTDEPVADDIIAEADDIVADESVVEDVASDTEAVFSQLALETDEGATENVTVVVEEPNPDDAPIVIEAVIKEELTDDDLFNDDEVVEKELTDDDLFNDEVVVEKELTDDDLF